MSAASDQAWRSGPAWEGLRALRLAERRREAEGIASVWLEDPQGEALPGFAPGQYLTLEVPVPGGPPLVRCYSLSAPLAASGGRYRLTIKAIGAASRWLVETASPGALLPTRAPAGRFVIEPGPGPVVLIAGGIGVTPLACMAAGLKGQPRPTWLILGARSRRELALEDELRALAARSGLRLVVALSRPGPGEACDHVGRVDAQLLTRLLPPSDAPYGFYLCGPPAMTADLTRGLVELGVPASALHEELFGPATVRRLRATARLTPALLPAEPARPAQVVFARSGKRATWTPEAGTLLELAERARAPIPSACLAGRCGTCLTRVASGTVRHLVTPGFGGLREGACLPCVAVPDGDVTLEA